MRLVARRHRSDSPADSLAGATTGRRRPTRRHSRLGLRNRVTLTFALGSLALSTTIGAITYFTTRSSILRQAESSIANEAYANATLLRQQLGDGVEPTRILTEIDESALTQSALWLDGRWVFIHVTLREASLPADLRRLTINGHIPSAEVLMFQGSPSYAVGVPIPAAKAAYFEVFSLGQTARNLQIILVALLTAGAVTTIAGALLGLWASGRALRPLRDVSQAALAIESGRLDTRLEVGDVRDLAVLASSFNRMVDRLQQRIERDARFTSDVSHELRSPLTTLAASLSVLEARREELPERSQKALELLAAEIRRFQRMVGDLLEISRLDVGSADVDRSVVEVGELVRNSVSTTGASVPVEVEPEAAGRLIAVDKRRFERIMANLLDNARRYAGGATRVGVAASGQSVRVAVEDEGPGIDPSDRTRVFERFARGTVAAGSRGAGDGTGLGLALVAEHAKLHGGRVWVEPGSASGARFVVELPMLEEDRAGPGGDETEVCSEAAEGVDAPDAPDTPRPKARLTTGTGGRGR